MATTANRDYYPPPNPESAGELASTSVLTRPLPVNWQTMLFVAIFLLAVFTRFYDLGARAMSHDESLHTYYSYLLYDRGDFKHTPLMHGPILFHATAFFYSLFGVNDFAARVYAAALGVLMVMSPLLFRRWLGTWGTILACVMILISPLLMYYNRYIREDTPNIMATILMVWGILMYLNGPENQRRRAHWLYIIAATMLWSLGSKETSFMYIMLFGLFLTFYWIVRMIQRAYNRPGRMLFSGFTVTALVAGVAALGMYIVLDITPIEQIAQAYGLTWFVQIDQRATMGDTFLWMVSILVVVVLFAAVTALLLLAVYFVARRIQQMLNLRESAVLPLFLVGVALVMVGYFVFDQIGFANMQALRGGDISVIEWENAAKTRSFITWSFLVMLVTGLIVTGTMVWGLTGKLARIPWRTMLLLLVGAVLALAVLIIVEEFSYVEAVAETVAQAVPGENGEAASTGTFSWTPILLAWFVGLAGIAFLLYTRSAGWWKWLHGFPELDVLMLMGSLVLPWVTAIFIYMAKGAPQDFINISAGVPEFIKGILPVAGEEMVGKIVVGFLAWLPLMAAAIVAGLVWNWKRYIVASLIFHTLFAFFFTTIFTNIQGLATGMVYSLQYWLEQQGERRGSQPQYFYLLIVMPIYEYLPIIGSVLAMLAGMATFWRRRLRFSEAREAAQAEALTVRYAALTNPEQTPFYPDSGDDSITEAGFLENGDAPIMAEIQLEQPVQGGDSPDALAVSEVVMPVVDAETEAARLGQIREAVLKVGTLTQVPFLLMVSWWAIFMLILLTLAGEKMPWLGTHMTVPMIFLTAWFFGGIFDKIEFRLFTQRGWLYLLLMPLLFVALFQIIAGPMGNNPPFRGVTSEHLLWTYQWLLAVIVAGGVVVGLNVISRTTGLRHLWQMLGVAIFATLALLTFRTAWVASFINYDYANEFLVYAHATSSTKLVIDTMEDISKRTTDGMDLVFAYDNKLSWPGVWYFRDFTSARFMGETPTFKDMDGAAVILIGAVNRSTVEPLLEDRYQAFEYARMWWPMQDYFNLNATRILNTFALQSHDPDPQVAADTVNKAALVRRGLFDIWWMRDFSTYSQGVGSNITLTNWPVVEEMVMYVRKDIAAQVWQYGAGDGSAINPIAQEEVSLCVSNWTEIPAVLEFQTAAAALRGPIGVDVGADGKVYVAEDSNNRISVFNPDGTFDRSYGEFGDVTQNGLFFQRPNSVAVTDDGTIYVVDTWNFRIRKFNADWGQQTAWGSSVMLGINAPQQPTDGFWGPRDAALDADGNVYVSDTGNKRIRVYDPDGNWLRDIGSGGSGLGQLDEPSGLAVSPDGRLFVADTWNRRISVFMLDGTPLTTYPVRGWYDQLGNRPYLAYDGERNMLYVTDPDAGRVLVLDSDGQCLGAFGQLNRESPTISQFSTIGGIALDDEGFVYVVDLATGRLLKFAPFVAPETEFSLGSDPADLGMDTGSEAGGEGDENVPPEASAETSE